MKIRVLSIGKTSTQFLQVGRDEYLKRLKHYTRLEWVEIADPKHANKLNPKQLKEAEGRLLLQHFDKTEHVVLLDENGKQLRANTTIMIHARQSFRGIGGTRGGPQGGAGGWASLNCIVFTVCF